MREYGRRAEVLSRNLVQKGRSEGATTRKSSPPPLRTGLSTPLKDVCDGPFSLAWRPTSARVRPR